MTGFLLFVAVALPSWALNSPLPLVAYVMGVLLLGAWRNRGGQHLVLYRQIRPIMVVQCLGVLVCIAAVVAALLSLGNPILDFSWFGLLLQRTGDTSTALTGPGGGPAGGNVLIEPLAYHWLALPFIALLFYLLPQLAMAEEQLFRRGTRNWVQGVYRSVAFGLAHLPMGIPLGAALALSIGGLWFTYQYFRGGVARSATHHLTYNVIALCVIVVLVLVPLP